MSTYYVRHKLFILTSLDSDEKQIGFERSSDTVIQTTRQDCTEGKAETRTVAASATDESLAFGGIATAKVLYIETDQELTLKFNGGAESIALKPTSGSNAKFFCEGEFTGVTVTNPSASNDATVTFMIAG